MSTPRIGRYHHCRFCNTPFNPPKSNNTCSACANKVRSVRKRMMLDGFLESGCVDCGESDPVVLEIHHTVARNGREASAATNGRTPSQLQRHLEGCEVLCANCHKRRHASGTVLDRYGHMVGRGTAHPSGYQSPHTVITPEIHQAMIGDRRSGMTYKQIAKKHRVGMGTVCRWLKREIQT